MKILMTMFGWNDVGGGTSYPRQVAVDLVQAGHDVLVFYAAVHEQFENTPPEKHRLVHHSEDGVKLVAVHDRANLFLDIRRPDLEVNQTGIAADFKAVFEDFQPDVVHYHNFLGLSIGIVDIAYQAGVPSIFSAHNFWMICPSLYLWLPQGKRCHGINTTGSNCQACSQGYPDPWHPTLPTAEQFVQRMQAIRTSFQEKVNYGLVNSKRVLELFLENGYTPDQLRVQKLSNPRAEQIWNTIGKTRLPAAPKVLRIGFIGQVIPIKGVHILVAAAQQLVGAFELHIHGVVEQQYQNYLSSLDTKHCVFFHGAFNAQEQLAFLGHLDLGVVTSIWYEHSALVITELLGARIPVIGANIGGIPDYLQPESCLTYPAEDPIALAHILQDLLNHPDKIMALQKNIQAPESPKVYLNAILNDYTRMIEESSEMNSPLYQQRLRSFLKGRQKSEAYQTVKLYRSTGQPLGLDIHQAEDLALWENEIQTAQWIISPSVEVLKILEQRRLKAHFLPLSRQSNSMASQTENSEQMDQPSILIPLTPDGSWKQSILACANHSSVTDFVWTFFPWELDFQSAQHALVAFLDANENSMVQTLDMALLELDHKEEPKAIFADAEGLILPKIHSLSLRYLALATKNIIFAGDHKLLEGLFQERKPQNDLGTLAEALESRVFKPLYDTVPQHEEAVVLACQQIFGQANPKN